MKNLILKSLLLLFLSTQSFAQKADELIDIKFQEFSNQGVDYLAIQVGLKDGWHVYWKNPGDSGIATDFKFSTKNNALTAKMMEWPTPILQREAGELWTFGYKEQKTFFAKLKYNNKKNDELLIVSDFLVCKELCLPGKFTFNLDINAGKINIPLELSINSDPNKLVSLLNQLPVERNLPSTWNWALYHLENSTKLRLRFTLPSDAYIPKDQHLMTSFPSQPFNFRHFDLSNNIFLMEIDWDGQYQDPIESLPLDGKFSKNHKLSFLWHNQENNSSVISLDIENFKTVNQTEWDHLTTNAATLKVATPTGTPTNIFLMILFAILGGFILNFMPCVLPVISLKLYSLIHHMKKPKSVLIKHHTSYTLGILISFWVLAVIIILIKHSGEAVGWGFQLQSPTFVWVMILLFFILSLNLFGLFELQTPGGKIISSIRSHHPYIDDFLAGLLAVIVATPCSAPFLGPALTYAFSTSAMIIFIMFTAMGFGLALPFIITALIPSTLSLLPRPGAWMNTFKFLMGLALLITCVWLFEVLQQLGNFFEISFMLYLVLILVFFTVFIYQKEKKLTPLVIFILCFTLFNLYRSFSLLNHQFSYDSSSTKTTDLWRPWSEKKVAELLSQNKAFFIDATAKWCITCQVNKKLVFETKDFETMVREKQLITMRIDWTKKDEILFNWMQQHGAVSVPAYFLGVNGKIIFLGETISIGKIENALQNP